MLLTVPNFPWAFYFMTQKAGAYNTLILMKYLYYEAKVWSWSNIFAEKERHVYIEDETTVNVTKKNDTLRGKKNGSG